MSEAGNIPSYSLSKGLYFCYNHTSAAPDPVTLSAQRGTQHAVTLHKVIKKQLANNMHICCGGMCRYSCPALPTWAGHFLVTSKMRQMWKGELSLATAETTEIQHKCITCSALAVCIVKLTQFKCQMNCYLSPSVSFKGLSKLGKWPWEGSCWPPAGTTHTVITNSQLSDTILSLVNNAPEVQILLGTYLSDQGFSFLIDNKEYLRI